MIIKKYKLRCRKIIKIFLTMSIVIEFLFPFPVRCQEPDELTDPVAESKEFDPNEDFAESFPVGLQTVDGVPVSDSAVQTTLGVPKPIVFDAPSESLEERMARHITLDVREMNIIDVIKFLALKGDFNVVANNTVVGRSTLYLKSVSIKDALDILLISNRLGCYFKKDIVHILSGSEYEVMFGKTYADQNEVSIIHLDYAKPSYVLSALENMKSSLGRIIIDEDTGAVVLVDTPEAIERMEKAIVQMESQLEPYVYTLQYATADVIAEKLNARLETHSVGTVTADERSNQVIVRALPGRRKEIEALIKSLDEATKEVLVEARVMQVVFKPQYDMGIDWSLAFKKSRWKEFSKLSFQNILMDEAALTTSDNLSSTFGKIAIGTINVGDFGLAIRALKQVSDTKILSNPKILVTNNQEAKIHIGDTIPYIVSTTSGTGDNAVTSEDVRFVDVGIKLNVIPTINDEGFVTMRLKPEISTVVGSIASQGGGIPQVNKTEVQTTVMVKDGSTVILGGLKKDNKVHINKGVPVLMDIPFVGKLFQRTADTITTTEIMIFITPHIVSGKTDYTQIRGAIKPVKSYEGVKTE